MNNCLIKLKWYLTYIAITIKHHVIDHHAIER